MSDIYLPEDWSVVSAAVQSWLEDESGVTVVLQEQNAPSPAKPFVRWGTLVPPVEEGRLEYRNSGIAVAIVSPLEDETDYTISIDGDDYTYTSDVDATLPEVLQGLIDAVNDNSDFTAEAVTTSALQIDVTADNAVEVTDNLLLKVAEQYLGVGVMTLTVEALTDSLQLAWSLTKQLSMSLETGPVIEALGTAGLALVSVEAPRKTTQITGAKWEDRAGFDVRFRVRTRNVKILDYIEDIGDVDLDLEA